MLIQCQSCASKYRLSLEHIPRRSTFVRCKHCGTPIYVRAPEADEPERPGDEATVIPPQDAAPEAWGGGAGEMAVTCPNCAAHYRVPAERVLRPGIKLKCSQCAQVFAPPAGPEDAAAVAPARAAAPPREPWEQAPPSGGHTAAAPGAADVQPAAPPGGLRAPGGAAQTRARIEIPPETLADLGSFQDPETFDGLDADLPSDAPLDPDQAYLEATSLGAEEDMPISPKEGGVSPQQREQLFLDPGTFRGSQGAVSAPADDDLPLPDDLPPLDEVPPPPKAPPAPARSSAASPPPRGQAGGGGGPPDDDSARLPAIRPEEPDRKANVQRESVPDPSGWLTTAGRRGRIAVAAAGAFVVAVTLVWGVWLNRAPSGPVPFVIETGRSHQLALQEPLEVRFVANRPSGKRLLVIQGQVENRFPAAQDIGWIRLRGTAYADAHQTQPLVSALAFAGNVLSDAQLETMDPAAIRGYLAFINGHENTNYRIPEGKRVPFQIVLFDPIGEVARTVADVISYHRDGQAVYVDTRR
jgi:predicted Zn finger-like uncharacterized protein